MDIRIVTHNGNDIAIANSSQLLITDTQSALDLMATIGFTHRCQRVALSKDLIHEDFFALRTGFAGEIMQKFVNYGIRLAIYGDFSSYTSKALADFIFESNKGHHIFFASSEAQAIDFLK